jgi:hypothetical protein
MSSLVNALVDYLHDFLGACIDTGAQRTVVGLSQARAYSRHFGIPFKLNPSHSIFRFGQDPHASMGTLEIRIPTSNGGFLPVNVDVISIYVLFLIGLDFLDREGLNCLTVENKLTCWKGNRSVPLERKLGHVY